MTRIFIVSLLFGFFMGYAVRGHAAERSLAIGAALGYGPASLADSESADLDSGGNFREALATATLSNARFAGGLGIGFFATELTGSRTNAGTASGMGLQSYRRETAGEVARLTGRYRIDDRFEAGIGLDLLFGSDVAFGAGAFGNSRGATWLGAGEILYAFRIAGAPLKAGLRAFTSLGLPDRTLSALQGVLEAGVLDF